MGRHTGYTAEANIAMCSQGWTTCWMKTECQTLPRCTSSSAVSRVVSMSCCSTGASTSRCAVGQPGSLWAGAQQGCFLLEPWVLGLKLRPRKPCWGPWCLFELMLCESKSCEQCWHLLLLQLSQLFQKVVPMLSKSCETWVCAGFQCTGSPWQLISLEVPGSGLPEAPNTTEVGLLASPASDHSIVLCAQVVKFLGPQHCLRGALGEAWMGNEEGKLTGPGIW